MKFNDLTTSGTKVKASELMTARIEAEASGRSFSDFLSSYDFDNQRDIEKAVRLLVLRETEDLFMRNKDNQKDLPSVEVLFRRAMGLRVRPDVLDKFATNTAAAVWASTFAPKARAEKIAAAFAAKPDGVKFALAADTIKKAYHLQDTDIEKLRFFVCQVKAGEEFPKALRRMLYLWGTAKKTGKTTTAEIVAALLNGDDGRGEGIYTTSLSREMQVEQYAVPIITSCRCAVMDEAFYRDMRKTYSKFKSMMTTTDGTARLPYGQTFTWHGLPNYIATSNEGLQAFIEDYDDRRFLAVHFTGRPEQMEEAHVTALWRDFVVNAVPPAGTDFQAWADDIAAVADEQGARGVTVADLIIYYQSTEWAAIMKSLPDVSRYHSSNRLTSLRLAVMTANAYGLPAMAKDYKAELERAFCEVFGPKVPGQSWWSICDCKQYYNTDNQQLNTHNNDNDNDNDNVPF